MVLFKVKKMNWSSHASFDWQSTEWEINRDGTYSYINDGGYSYVESGKQYTEITGKMNPEDFQKLIVFLENEFEEASKWKADACDGTGWEMTLFDKAGNIVNEFKGYIYGSEPLERLVKMLP